MQTAVADDAERSSEFSVSGGLTVSAGFAGLTKTAAWTPIRVRLPAGESATRLRVWAADTEDQPVGSPWQDFTTTAAGELEATVHIRLGRPDGQLAVELADADGSRAPQTVDIAAPLPQSASLVLVLGDLTAASRGVRLLEDDDGWRPTVVTATVDDLPGSSSLDFDAADAVVVCGSVCPLPEPVFKALDGWIRDGGRLVFLAGDSLEKLAAADTVDLFRQLFRRRTSPSGWFGVKAHWPQFQQIMADEEVCGLFNFRRYLHIERRDRLAQAISWVIAQQSSAWISFHTPNDEPRYDFDAIRNALNVIDAHSADWKQFFATHGIEPLSIIYEDLVATPDATVESVLAHCGLTRDPTLARHTEQPTRQASHRNEIWAQRYRADIATKAAPDER